MAKAPGPYVVEVDQEGCEHCQAGRTWTVFDPDETAIGRSFELKEDADDIAEYMNMAYEAAKAEGGPRA